MRSIIFTFLFPRFHSPPPGSRRRRQRQARQRTCNVPRLHRAPRVTIESHEVWYEWPSHFGKRPRELKLDTQSWNETLPYVMIRLSRKCLPLLNWTVQFWLGWAKLEVSKKFTQSTHQPILLHTKCKQITPGDIFLYKKKNFLRKFFFPFSGIRAFLEKNPFAVSTYAEKSLAFRVQIPGLWHFVFRSLGVGISCSDPSALAFRVQIPRSHHVDINMKSKKWVNLTRHRWVLRSSLTAADTFLR